MEIVKWEDIETAAKEKGVEEIISANVQRYYSIDISQAMSDLTQVGDLLKLAYAGSKDFKSCEKVVLIMSRYQSLLKDSRVACVSFVDASISALKYHKTSINLAEQGKLATAAKIIAQCAKVAGLMAEESTKLVTKSQTLCDLAEAALVSVTQDSTLSVEQKKACLKSVSEYKEKEAKLKTAVRDLNEQVEQEKEKELQAAKEAQDVRSKAFTLSIVSACLQPLSSIASAMSKPFTSLINSGPDNFIQNILQFSDGKIKLTTELQKAQVQLVSKRTRLSQLNAEENRAEREKLEVVIAELEAEIAVKSETLKSQQVNLEKVEDNLNRDVQSAQQKETGIAKRRAALQKEFREANADLAGSISKLQNLKAEDNDLTAAIASLEVAVKTIGRIKTVFENARLFWMGVEKQCKKLSDSEVVVTFAEAELKDEFVEEVKFQRLSWLTLAKILRAAALCIQAVDHAFDEGAMKNLPAKTECIQLVSTLGKSMLEQIEVENAKLSLT